MGMNLWHGFELVCRWLCVFLKSLCPMRVEHGGLPVIFKKIIKVIRSVVFLSYLVHSLALSLNYMLLLLWFSHCTNFYHLSCLNWRCSCGDGTLGVPSQRGDNYECRNMKLLLKQQQRVIIWLLIVLMTNIAKCSPILAHVCGGWGGEMFSNLEIPCWFLCLFHD